MSWQARGGRRRSRGARPIAIARRRRRNNQARAILFSRRKLHIGRRGWNLNTEWSRQGGGNRKICWGRSGGKRCGNRRDPLGCYRYWKATRVDSRSNSKLKGVLVRDIWQDFSLTTEEG
jgi:hypothetical protein